MELSFCFESVYGDSKFLHFICPSSVEPLSISSDQDRHCNPGVILHLLESRPYVQSGQSCGLRIAQIHHLPDDGPDQVVETHPRYYHIALYCVVIYLFLVIYLTEYCLLFVCWCHSDADGSVSLQAIVSLVQIRVGAACGGRYLLILLRQERVPRHRLLVRPRLGLPVGLVEHGHRSGIGVG